MHEAEVDWDGIFHSARFKRLAHRRRNTIVTLGVLAGAYYFSIPALIAWAPDFFRIRLMTGINLGTVFAISQYPVGGLIAFAFLRRTAAIDREAANVELHAQPSASGEQKHAY